MARLTSDSTQQGLAVGNAHQWVRWVETWRLPCYHLQARTSTDQEMADEAKIGTVWTDDELDAIVAGYFAMLDAHLLGRPYVKASHSRVLMARIGRTHRSVEFKHQNISAVLDELGMPWIPGYIPKRNYQNAIFGAIDRYLSQHREVLEFVPRDKSAGAVPSTVFVEPPALQVREPPPAALKRLVRKFAIGKAGGR